MKRVNRGDPEVSPWAFGISKVGDKGAKHAHSVGICLQVVRSCSAHVEASMQICFERPVEGWQLRHYVTDMCPGEDAVEDGRLRVSPVYGDHPNLSHDQRCSGICPQ